MTAPAVTRPAPGLVRGDAVLKAPYPYFGGKSRVAKLVWSRLGDVTNYIEPFAGSAAMLLRRPHDPKIETLNDVNCHVANFWRATQHDPEAVVVHADGPVNEADLHARHRWLVLSTEAVEFRDRMRADPDYFDPKIAGWWCWGSCCWIGSGWCETPDEIDDRSEALGRASATWEQVPDLGGWNGDGQGSRGVHQALPTKRPKLSGGAPDSGALGTGVHANGPSRQLPDLSGDAGAAGRGVDASAGHKKRPNIGGSANGTHYGKGVHAKGPSDQHRPQLADVYARGRGVHGHDIANTCQQRREWLLDWFGQLRDRLRTVRVCCGDWRRVCESHSVTTRLGLTGLFLDPPYPTHANGVVSRAGGLYASDGDSNQLDKLRDEILAYCLERGADRQMRIAVCGYDTDGYAALEAAGWACEAWKASGGYGSRTENGKANAARERLWFSPHCLKPERVRLLWDMEAPC